MILIDGNKIANEIKEEISLEVQQIKEKGGKIPYLVALIVGHDGASETYVGHKEKACTQVGFRSDVLRYKDTVTEEEILKKVDELNKNPEVDGFIVQLPLPKHIEEKNVLESILPSKDVDGLTSVNLGRLFKNDPSSIPPATAKGILELLKEYNIQILGSNAVVVGRSDIVGLPTAALLQNENATVTICHSHTGNLKEICKRADILVVGIGRGKYVNSEYISKGCTVIDVGTNRDIDGSLVGDVDFESVKDIVKYITPVPGGVGPMTISCLLKNLMDIYKRNI